MGFLTTRVSGPDQDDWNKLKQVLQYLRGTIDLVLTLEADDLLSMFAWVDVSYGMHNVAIVTQEVKSCGDGESSSLSAKSKN